MRRLVVTRFGFDVDAADGIVDAMLVVPIIAHLVLHVPETGAGGSKTGSRLAEAPIIIWSALIAGATTSAPSSYELGAISNVPAV